MKDAGWTRTGARSGLRIGLDEAGELGAELFGDEVGVQPSRPQIRGDPFPRKSESPVLEPFADPADVALEEGLGVTVLLRVHGLGEVDQGDLALPDQDVVGGEVAVNHIAVEHLLDRPTDLRPERLQLLDVVEPVLVQPRGRRVLVADVAHEDRLARPFDRTGNGRAAGEELEGLPLAGHPPAALDLSAEPRLLVQGDPDPALLDELAVAVEGLVAKVATVQGVVALQRDQVLAGGARVRPAEVDAGLLAVFEGFQDLFDEPFIEEVLESFVWQRGCSFWLGMRACENRVPRTGAGAR